MRLAWLPTTLVVLASIAAAAVILRAGRGTSFYFDDEWLMMVQRRNPSIDDFLRPHASHLIAVPVAVYNLLFATVGVGSYVPYRIVLVALHLTTCALLYVYLRRRAPVVYAVAATVMMLFLGRAWEDLLWAFQITYQLSAATGLVALLLLDRRDRGGDAGACAALALSIASGGVGLVFAAGAVVELAWSRRDLRRLWVAFTPLAGFGLWYLVYGRSRGSVGALGDVSWYLPDLAGSAAHALFGTSLGIGEVVAGALIVVTVVAVVRAWPITGRFANCLAMMTGFWLLLTYSRDDRVVGVPSRYLFISALFIVLVGAEVLTTVLTTWERRRLPAPLVAAACIAGALVLGHSLVVNVAALDDGAEVMRGWAAGDPARFGMLAFLGERADRDVRMSLLPEPESYGSGEALDAIHDLEIPVMSRRELLSTSDFLRREVDLVTAALLGGTRTADDRTRAIDGTLDIAVADGGAVTVDGSCATLSPAGADGHLVLRGDAVAARVTAGDAPVEVTPRSLGDGFPGRPLFVVPPGRTRIVDLRASGLAPWEVQLATSGGARVCSLR